MQAERLPSKFNPHILNHMQGHAVMAIDQNFANLGKIFDKKQGFQWIGGKSHVMTHPELPNWIIKGARFHNNDIPTTWDTHIFRVRKATRIQNIIQKREFKEVTVPKKYLYQHNNLNWYVIAEKLDIDERITLNKQHPSEKKLKSRALTDNQAQAIAYLCFEGNLGDIHKENLVFTKDNALTREVGKIAIIDTEPTDRAYKKQYAKRLRWIPHLKSCLQFYASMVNSERLISIIRENPDNPTAEEAVRLVQSEKFRTHALKIVFKIALPIILSIGALVVAIFLANPVGIGIAAGLTAAAGLHAIAGLVALAYSTYQYCYVRSERWHRSNGLP